MKRYFVVTVVAAALAAGTAHAASDQKLTYTECRAAGLWLEPTTGAVLAPRPLIKKLASKKIVLLGERHAVENHQLWQAHMLAALSAYQPDMIVGFEMFPRAVQPALDAWARGQLDRAAFLDQSDWQNSWGYPIDAYMPIFDFVRQNRVASRAINVDRDLISRVGRSGWAATPEEARLGIGDPAPASEGYRTSLATVFAEKMRRGVGRAGDAAGAGEAPDLDAIKEMEAFRNFVDAQLTWDRAMAEGLAKARKSNKLAVGIMGRGHAEFGHGVPHQLADLGIDDVAVLLAVESGEECEQTPVGIADAIFLVDPAPAPSAVPERPRLGVMIESTDAGVRVLRVVDDSIAEKTGLLAGDVIVSAAGTPLAVNEELIEIIQRQAPGTWLPLSVRRDDVPMEFVAKFPAKAASSP